MYKVLDKISFKQAITTLIFVFIFYFLHEIIFKTIPPNNDKYVTAVIELVKAITYILLGYWFGSSISSSKKDDTLSKQLDKKIEENSTEAIEDNKRKID